MNTKIIFGSHFFSKKLQDDSIKKNTHPQRYLIIMGFVLSLFMVSLFSFKDASATHFRYGNISWKRVVGNDYQIEFKVSQAWRRDYPWGGPLPVVGSVVTTGAMSFGAGQGSTNVNLTVTSVNAAENWFYGEATILKTYPVAVANYLVVFSGCCRISTLAGGNNDKNYVNQTLVTIGNQNDAPVSTMPPFINRPNNIVSTFQIPATDPNGHNLTYSLATLAETGLVALTPGLTVSPTGLVTFDPAGKPLNSQWACAVKIQDQLGAFIIVDFIVKVVGPSTPPVFTYPPTPANNFTYLIQPGQNVNFTVRATDIDAGDVVALSGVGIPVGATFAPASGNPVLSTFNWTPLVNQLGTYVVNFIAQDLVGVQSNTVVNIVVSLKPQFVVPPTPGNNSTFCILPGATMSNTITASDPDPLDVVVLTANAIPAMTFSPALPTVAANPTSTTLTYAPLAANWGLKHLIMTATDSYNETEQNNIYYIVNDPPTFTSVPITTAIVNQLYTYTGTTADLNAALGDEVGVESFSIPAFLTFVDNNNGTFTISGTPTLADLGSYPILIEIEDEMNHINGTHCGNAVQNYTLDVQGTPPVITCPGNITDFADAGVCNKANVMFAATATGIPAPTITYSIAPGSTFAVGTTTVTATATNAVGSVSCTFDVIISDNQAPVADVASLPTVTGECSASVTAPTATDNCVGTVIGTTLDPTTYNVQGTYTVNWTYNDGNGNTSSQMQTVIVDDVTPPVAACTNYTLDLVGGVGNITAANIDNGSSDNCGIASMTVSPDNFTCADAGSQTVTLTVTDIGGNVSTCTAIVTVQYQPTCSIAVVPANNIYTGGVPNNIYLGYGPQSATLNSSVNGGAGFTYSWAPATYLSCTNCASPVFTPIAAGTITYTLTVTNGNGCVTECEVTMCVIDARAVGKGNNGKVIICHVPPGNPNNPQTLSISPNAVNTHLTLHAGDQLGACGISCGANRNASAIEGQLLENDMFETIVYPNPTSKEFTIVVNSESKSPIMAAMFDMTGKKIMDMNDIQENVPYTVSQQLATGMYLIKIEQNGYSQSVRLIKE